MKSKLYKLEESEEKDLKKDLDAFLDKQINYLSNLMTRTKNVKDRAAISGTINGYDRVRDFLEKY